MPDDKFRYNVGLKNLVNSRGKRASRTAFTFMRPSCKPFVVSSNLHMKAYTTAKTAAILVYGKPLANLSHRFPPQNDPSMSWQENSLDEAAAFVRISNPSPQSSFVSCTYLATRYHF